MSKEQEKEAKAIADEMIGGCINEYESEEPNIAEEVVSSLRGIGEDVDGAIVVLYKNAGNNNLQLNTTVYGIPAGALLAIPGIILKDFGQGLKITREKQQC